MESFYMVSTGGLEPPRIAPHAPETCVSTISPRRQNQEYNFQTCFVKW